MSEQSIFELGCQAQMGGGRTSSMLANNEVEDGPDVHWLCIEDGLK